MASRSRQSGLRAQQHEPVQRMGTQEQIATRALRGTPLLEAIFEHLIATKGIPAIRTRLQKHLVGVSPAGRQIGPPSSAEQFEELAARAAQWSFHAVAIDPQQPAWKFTWRSNTQGVGFVTTLVSPWESIPELGFELSPPADLHRARHEALVMWEEATAAFQNEIGGSGVAVFGRVGGPTAPYQILDADLISRLAITPRSNDAAVDEVPIFSVKIERAQPAVLGRPGKVAEVARAISDIYKDGKFPVNKTIREAVEKKLKYPVSPSTLGRAIKLARSKYVLTI